MTRFATEGLAMNPLAITRLSINLLAMKPITVHPVTMKRLAITFLASMLAFLAACGGGGGGQFLRPIPPSPPTPDFSGNWQLTTISKSGIPPMVIAGSMSQSGSAITGAVHVDGSTCFDHLTTLTLTGTTSNDRFSASTAAQDSQVLAITGTSSGSALAGTYVTTGGCGGGDEGEINGSRISALPRHFDGTLTSSAGSAFTISVDGSQLAAASPAGSFGISGKATFGNSCLGSGFFTSGTFPSASFILGESVVMEVGTAGGAMTLVGTLDPNKGQITGDYSISGGGCNQDGTAVLTAPSNPWDY